MSFHETANLFLNKALVRLAARAVRCSADADFMVMPDSAGGAKARFACLDTASTPFLSERVIQNQPEREALAVIHKSASRFCFFCLWYNSR